MIKAIPTKAQGDDRIERCAAVSLKLMVEFAFFTAFDWFALAMRAPSRWCPQPVCRFIPNPCFCKFCIGLLAEMLDILHFQVIGGDERSKQGSMMIYSFGYFDR